MQAQRFGVEIIAPQEAVSLRAEGPYRIVKLANGSEISCHAALIATGVQWKRLDVPGMDRLQGAGYYGGGSQEALSCKGEIVYIVGGANSAGQAALNFAKFADKVVMLLRGDSLSATMSRYLIDQIERTPNIQLWTHAEVTEVHGDTHLEGVSVLCTDTQKVESVPATSMFIFIGAMPRTDWLEGTVVRDDRGFVVAGPDLIHDGKMPASWGLSRPPFLLESSLAGSLRCRRCAARVDQTGCVGGGRGRDCGAVYSSLHGEGIEGDKQWRASLEKNYKPFRSFRICRTINWTGFCRTRPRRDLLLENVYVRAGEAADRMMVVLEGELQVRRDDAPDTVFTISAKAVSGLLPFSRMKVFPGTGRATAPTHVLTFPAALFDQLIARMPELAQRLVSTMVDRTREGTRMEQQRDRLGPGKTFCRTGARVEQPCRSGSPNSRAPAGGGGRVSQFGESAGKEPADRCGVRGDRNVRNQLLRRRAGD